MADRLGLEEVVAGPLGPEVALYSAGVAGQVDTAVWEPQQAAIRPDQAPAWVLARTAETGVALQNVAARMQP
jgi:hypothetical protein